MSDAPECVRDYAPDPSLTERIGLRVLRGQNRLQQTRVCAWSDRTVAAVNAEQRRATRLAALIGAVSGGLLAGTEIVLRTIMDVRLDSDGGWQVHVPFWSTYLGIVVVVSGAEIVLLYRMVLRAVARMGADAGIALTRSSRDRVVARGLLRAGLDQPNPRIELFGIDPYRHVPRWRQLLYALVYRAKISVTSFLVRTGARRLFARAAMRFFVPLLAVPVFAIWNALIIRWTMHAARVRAAGPIAVERLAEELEAQREALAPQARRLALDAVAGVVMNSGNAHPNYLLLLWRLFDVLDGSPEEVGDEWSSVRRRIAALPEDQAAVVLRVATAAVLITGRRRGPGWRLLRELHDACGRPFDPGSLLPLLEAFLDGQGIPDAHRADAPTPHPGDPDTAVANGGRS